MTNKLEILAQDEQVQSSLNKALKWLGEENNSSLELINKGGQGLIYRLKSEKYPYDLNIKVPFYEENKAGKSRKENILLDYQYLQLGASIDENLFPKLVYCDPDGDFLIREYAEGILLHNYIENVEFEKRLNLFEHELDFTRRLFDIFHRGEDVYILKDYRASNIVIHRQLKRMVLIDCGSIGKESEYKKSNGIKEYRHLGSGDCRCWGLERLLEMYELCDRRLDFFSYGVLAYHTLFQEFPYKNLTKDPDVAWKVFHEEYEVAKKRLLECEELKSIRKELIYQVIGCLHPDPHKRFCGKLVK